MGGADVPAILHDRLTTLVAAVRDAERRVAEGDPEGVHDLRVAVRRARSLLTTFRKELGAECCDALRVDLRAAGAELSGVRDLEVVEVRLRQQLGEQPADLVRGDVAGRIESHVRALRAEADPAVDALLGSSRWRTLLADLDALAERAPAGTRSKARKRLRKDWRRLQRRAARAAATADDQRRETALHEVRKAAKRARYTAETLRPLLGEDAARLEEVAEEVQQSLGTHRDTLLTRQTLRDLGLQAHLAGDDAFIFGRLHALEELAGAAALADYERVRERLDADDVVGRLG
jgi:CHAD domain-containing protein